MTVQVKWKPDEVAVHEAKLLLGIDLGEMRTDIDEKLIDWEQSKQEQSRIRGEEVDVQRIAQYATAMKTGSIFPALVFLKLANGNLLIIGGNHRGPAARSLGCKKFSGYVVDTEDAEIVDMLPRLLNYCHGVNPSAEDPIETAVRGVTVYGWSAEKAAIITKAGKSSIQARLLARKMQRKIADFHIRINPKYFSESTFRTLNRLAYNDNVFQAAVRLVNDAGLNSEETDVLVGETKRQGTETGQLAVIEAERERLLPKSREGKVIPEKPKRGVSSYKMALTVFERKTKQTLVQQGFTEPAHVQSILPQLRLVYRQLTKQLAEANTLLTQKQPLHNGKKPFIGVPFANKRMGKRSTSASAAP